MNLIISAVTWDAQLRAGMRQQELIKLAKSLGVIGVEFRPYWQNAAEEVPAIKIELERNNLICTYASNECLFTDSREKCEQALIAMKKDLALAAALGAKVLRINVAPGEFDNTFLDAQWWQEAVSAVIKTAESKGISLAIENGTDAAKSDINLLKKIMKLFDSPWLRLTFDTGNWVCGGKEPEEALTILGDYVGYVHLKDIMAGPEGLIHSHPGTGVVDVRSLVRRLAANDYKGLLALEFPGGDEPEERVKASICYLK
jgi:sugar phosphate isomerase/epimerase